MQGSLRLPGRSLGLTSGRSLGGVWYYCLNADYQCYGPIFTNAGPSHVLLGTRGVHKRWPKAPYNYRGNVSVYETHCR